MDRIRPRASAAKSVDRRQRVRVGSGHPLRSRQGGHPCPRSTRRSSRCRCVASPTPPWSGPVELGVQHADFRLERIRNQDICAARRRAGERRATARRSGSPSGWCTTGTWGFASGVDLTAEAAVRVAEQAVDVARVSAAVNSEPVELADEPVYDDVSWVSAYDVDPFAVPDAEKIGRARRLVRAAAGRRRRSTTSTRGSSQVLENKFYADLAGTVTTQQRIRLHPALTAVAVDAAHGTFETMRTLAPPVGRGWEYLTGTGWDWDAELRRDPRAAGREAPRRRRSRPARYDLVDRPVQPLADHPRVDRPRHRARPRARLRGRLRRHVVRDLRQARHPAVRLRRHERHRRPHRRARPRHRSATTTRASPAQSWDLVRDGILVGYQLDRPDGEARRDSAAPTAAPSPTPRATSRSSGWPTCPCSRPPTARPPTS